MKLIVFDMKKQQIEEAALLRWCTQMLFFKSCVVDCWNCLPYHVVNASSLHAFKRYLSRLPVSVVHWWYLLNVYILYLLVVYSVCFPLWLVLVSHDLRVLAYVFTVYLCHLYTCHVCCFVPINKHTVYQPRASNGHLLFHQRFRLVEKLSWQNWRRRWTAVLGWCYTGK